MNALEPNGISAEVLKEMLADTSVSARDGDLLLLRTGFTRDYVGLNMEKRKELPKKTAEFLGVESTKDVVQWIWESGFVAVGKSFFVIHLLWEIDVLTQSYSI